MARRVVVIGGGPAGVTAAVAAAQAGATVTVVSDGPIGGRAGWDSLLPSKLWSGTAELAHVLGNASQHGIAGADSLQIMPELVLKRIKQLASVWSAQEAQRLRELGVTTLDGVARCDGPQALTVACAGQAATTLSADAIIVASGSVPRFPPTMKPDGKRIIAPRHMSMLASLPLDLVVVGGGVTGSEFVSLFNQLGVQVTWVSGERGILPSIAPAARETMLQAFRARGVVLREGASAERIETTDRGVVVTTSDGQQFEAAMAFLAIGRMPDLSRLNLAAAGVDVVAGNTLSVDGYGRTAVPSIYAVGDAVGGTMLANRAMAQAWVAGRHAAGQATDPYDPQTVVQAVYSSPEIAQVGVIDPQEGELRSVRLPFASALKAHLLSETEGWIELFYAPGGQVRGGVAVGVHAADVLAPIALGIKLGVTIGQLAAVFGANPAISELAFAAARAVR